MQPGSAPAVLTHWLGQRPQHQQVHMQQVSGRQVRPIICTKQRPQHSATNSHYTHLVGRGPEAKVPHMSLTQCRISQTTVHVSSSGTQTSFPSSLGMTLSVQHKFVYKSCSTSFLQVPRSSVWLNVPGMSR